MNCNCAAVSILNLNSSDFADIDQLSKILQIVGTPDHEFLTKITSDTVSE